ncbi:hypothetical protein Mapa_010079 [Marchantia paleacea]|nr:hypothetical protein Mapa_010079 [Marchantia paleacea]
MERNFPSSSASSAHGMFQGLLTSSRHSAARDRARESPLQEEGSERNPSLKRKFLRRLAIALVTYGSSSVRAEYLIGQAAERLNEKVNIGVFSSAILLIFPGAGDPSRDETYLDRIQIDSDVAKLQQADELANSVGLPDTPLTAAYRQLSAIAIKESPFGPWSMALGYTFCAPTSSLLFFNGNVWDAVFSLFLGFGVGLLALNSSRFPALGSTLEFLSAIFVSFVARIISVYFKHLNVCYFSMALSGLTWLLPGEGLTVGISEMVENSLISGTSRIVRALIASLQLGFGLLIGEKMVWWTHDAVQKDCTSSQLSEWWDVIWFLGFSVAVNVLLKARPWQWPGMTVAAGAGVLVDKFTGRFGSEVSAVLSSFTIGITGTLCSYVSRDIPLSMTLSGIQVILPGGLGVQGVEALMNHNVLSGIGFVMSMINISLSITLGLLISKIFIRDTGAGFASVFSHSRHTLASSFREERWKESKENEAEEDEQIAI